MIPPIPWRPAEEDVLHRKDALHRKDIHSWNRSEPRFWPPEIRPAYWPKPIGGGRGAHRPAPAAVPWEPEPVPADPGETKPRLRLSHPRWREAKGEFGGMATACVDAEAPPTAATRVVFRIWMEWGRGLKRDLPGREGHIPEGGGTVSVPIDLEPPMAVGTPVRSCRYYFSARHSLSDFAFGGPLEAGPGRPTPFAGLILYAPARGEYLWLPDATGVSGFLDETRKLRGLRDRAMLAWEDPDPARRADALRDLERESEKLFGGGSPSRAKGGLEELLLVGKNPRWNGSAAWFYVRPGSEALAAGSWHKEGDPAVRAELDKLLGPGGEKRISPFLKSKFKANLFRTQPKAGDAWHWTRADEGRSASEGQSIGGRSMSEGGTAGAGPGDAEPAGAGAVGSAGRPTEARRFAYTAEAALGRYFAGWDGVEASFDPGKKKLALGSAGSASLALFEGAVSLSLDLPDTRGLNMIGWLAGVKHRGIYLIDPDRTCRLKLRLQGSLSAFVGGSVRGAMSITGSFSDSPDSPDSRPAEAGGEAAAFAGAQGRGECRGALQWAPSPAGPFADLALLKAGLGASAGLGGEAKLKVGYAKGLFRFEISAGASLGLGLKGGVAFEVDARNALGLLGHLCGCVDFHFVEEISAEAFAAYRNYAFAAIIGELEQEGAWQAQLRAETDWARHLAGRFAEWLRERSGRIGRIKAEILARSGERSLLRKMPPEALGRVLRTLMHTREPEDFQGIRYILGSAVRDGEGPAARVSPEHKLRWVLRSVSDLPIPAAGAAAREAKKKEALEDGIRIIREFGMAEGRWAGQRGQTGESAFTAWFHRFLAENGI